MTELAVIDPFDPSVERIWRRLEVAASPSYFLSWGWVANWLACVPREHAPNLAVWSEDGEPIAACFLGERDVRGSTVLYLNTTGDELCDDLCIEHNGVLRAQSSPVPLAELVAHLPDDWNELLLPAIDRSALAELGTLGDNFEVTIAREESAPYVDLDLVRGVEGGYVSLLAPATRAQLSRSQSEVGPITLERATDERTAHAYYDELLSLSERRGHAFAEPWYLTVHRRLIATRFRHGEIQLLRVRAGGTTIGCIYGFAYAGRIAVYQTGLERFADPHVKPDFLCHAAAIEQAAQLGFSVYDLLARDARRTQVLSTGDTRQLWIRVRHLRGWKDAIAGWRHRRTDAGLPTRA